MRALGKNRKGLRLAASTAYVKEAFKAELRSGVIAYMIVEGIVGNPEIGLSYELGADLTKSPSIGLSYTTEVA